METLTIRMVLVWMAHPGHCFLGPLSCASAGHPLVWTSTDGWSRIGIAIRSSLPNGLLPDMPNRIGICLPLQMERCGHRRMAPGLGVMRLLQRDDGAEQGQVVRPDGL
jgi:hypothetical protein